MPRTPKPSGKKSNASRQVGGGVQRFLLICEGENTEPLYFKAFKQLWNHIEARSSKGSPRMLVDQAIARRRRRDYEDVWCVFDLDYNPARGEEQYVEFALALDYAAANGVKVAYSADAFEIWFRLHYENITGFIGREQLYNDLSQRWNIQYDPDGKRANYAKNIPQLLEEEVNADVDRAITLAEQHYEAVKELSIQEQGSVTNVYQLLHNLTTENRELRYQRRNSDDRWLVKTP